MKVKEQPTRNITPSFIRFRKSPIPVPLERQRSDRSSSKASKSSFQEYENIILQQSNQRLPVQCNVKSQKILNIIRNNRLVRIEQDKKTRTGSSTPEKIKDDMKKTSSFRQREFSKRRKSTSSSGSIAKYEPPQEVKRQQLASPDKEEIRAIQEKDTVIRNLIKNQKTPMTFVNKLKIRREDTKKTYKPIIYQKRGFFNDPTIKLNSVKNLNNYEIYGQLGKGAYGVVRMAFDKLHDQKVALKIYDKSNLDDSSKVSNVEREISIQAKISHPSIAKIIEAIEGPEEILIVQEYGGANSLYRYLLSKSEHRLEEREAKQFFKLITEAISYLHNLGVVHRDIKAENILINREHQLKIIDFGFSLSSLPPDTIDTFCGTPTYMAPEIVSKIDHVSMYTDVWSLGILLYVLLQGNYPFRAKCEEELFENIRKGVFGFIHDDTSDKSKAMIKRLLVVDPLKRPRLGELLLSKEWAEWFY